MRNICRMLAEYTNLYTDVSHHEVMRRNKRNELIKAFRRIQTEFPDSIEKIKKRILYGSDWHVLRRINKYAAFPDRYRQIMLKTGFYEEPSLPDFLGGNAMRFLGLLPGEANYKRLDRFYKSHHMEPPAWFQNAGTEKEARIMDQGV
jgi:predicted TIM-barrel fold metal-dependent hydrolase